MGEKYFSMTTDYLILFAFLGVIVYCGETFYPERSTPKELEEISVLYDPFNVE
jgi:hypothetical protein